MEDYQISIDKAIKFNVFKLARAIIARTNSMNNYTPVGLKCSKRDFKSLRSLYNNYSIDLIFGLLVDYGVKIGVIVK